MRSVRDLSQEEDSLFGPGTDLTLSLVAVLLVLIFALGRQSANAVGSKEELEDRFACLQEDLDEAILNMSRFENGAREYEVEMEGLRSDVERCYRAREMAGLDIAAVKENQERMVASLATGFHTLAQALGQGSFALASSAGAAPSVFVESDATLQRIRFGSHILFQSDQHTLRGSGEGILRVVATSLLENRESFSEIRIQGHADTAQTNRYGSNLDLASKRAVEVFAFLRARGVDPFTNLMSATSFGEFYPTARRNTSSYNQRRLKNDNLTDEMRRRNRRIEIELVYRRE